MSDLVLIKGYVEPKTKKLYEKHISENKYSSMSHFIEKSCDLMIDYDSTPLNRWFGAKGFEYIRNIDLEENDG